MLKAYAEQYSACVQSGKVQIELAEFNINQPAEFILRKIYETDAQMLLFSTYIWNRELIMHIVSDIRKLLPEAIIGLGGPEVSWSAEQILNTNSAVNLIFSGEGEQSLTEAIDRFEYRSTGHGTHAPINLTDIPGVYIRGTGLPGTGESISAGGSRPVIQNLDCIPFPYRIDNLDFDPKHRIVYYESSRGCPFSCAYCLSSLDKEVRYYSLDRVLSEIQFFLDNEFPLIKFVDRTFNLRPERYLTIWKYIRDHHNGKTLFHFEIAGEYLPDEAFAVLDTMPEGAIQLEIGIQSIHPETLQIVGRPAHPEKLAENIRRIPRIIHTHVDLIAGLPAENFTDFGKSFNFAFALEPGMLQTGFLKILNGTTMERLAQETPGFVWSSFPPYEVFASSEISCRDLFRIKDVEHLVDTWYNTDLMRNTLNRLAGDIYEGEAFQLFLNLADHTKQFYQDGDLFLPRRPDDYFSCLAAFLSALKKNLVNKTQNIEYLLEYLKYDYLLQGKPGHFPTWFIRRYSREAHDTALNSQGLLSDPFVPRRTAYARSEFERFRFTPNDTETAILFIYPEKNFKGKRTRIILL